nr:hypothetical protein BaRGS_000719 [Batillaria attramentaria]
MQTIKPEAIPQDFVTIATILGTGILGLPVTLTESGLYPFLISFLIDACMQSVLIHFFTDLLQRAYAVQLENQKEEAVPLNKLVEEEINIDYEDTGDALMKEVQLPDIEGRTLQPPNLHLLGKLFLGCGFQQAFDVLIILQFHFYVIPVFVWVLTFAIIFALRLIQPVISVLTFIKGTVLLATTVVAFYVGVSLGRTITNDFAHIGAPFLMGTVALGGTINTMPFTFEKIKYRKNQILQRDYPSYTWVAVLVELFIMGFVDILEKLVSFTMNGQAALFTFLMLLSARKMCTVEIPNMVRVILTCHS